MSIDRRAGPGRVPGRRADGQRTPRSGGRTAGQRHRSDPGARVRGRDLPVDGTAALRPQVSDPDAAADRPIRVWNSTGEPAPVPAEAGSRLRVAPPAPVSGPRAPFVALILVVVVGGVLGILLVNTRINENAFHLDRLQKQQAALDLREQQLQKQIAEHEAPGNLAAAARKLGLVESESTAFIRLPDGKVVGVPQPAGERPAVAGQSGAGG
jgi:hypothetical protein